MLICRRKYEYVGISGDSAYLTSGNSLRSLTYMGQTQAEHPEARRIAWKIFLLQQVNLFTTMPFALFVIYLVTPVPPEKAFLAFSPFAFTIPFFGVIAPLQAVRGATRKALAYQAGDVPGARLERILKLPRLVELQVTVIYALGTLVILGWVVYVSGLPAIAVPWGTMVIVAMVMLVMIWTRIFIERLLMPLALEEFTKRPDLALSGSSILWPKQNWYLPYSFAVFITCTVLTMGTVIIRVSIDKYEALLAVIGAEAGQKLQQMAMELLGALWLPLAMLGTFMLVSSAFSALLLARHHYNGFQAIQRSIEGFVGGNPTLPEWVTTDELGDLARVTAQAFNKVREFSSSLKQTAASLGDSAHILDQSNTAQNMVITKQAAALQEAQVTAQEIRQTSLIASQKADGVLQQTQVMEQLGREGEAAIASSISSLQEIREQVTTMASSIKMLGERARQIENITRTVKDLADQSNMLALNAAIEAVRSGEHGKGFGVVAREIRSLADQSIQATGRVRQILQDISLAIRSTVEMTEQGASRVGASVEQVRAFGDSMRKLSSIMQDNVSAVRQISAAVNQQNVGVNQIFQAINDLNTIMNEAMTRLNETSTVTTNVRGVASHVSQLISNYGWSKTTWKQPQEPAQ